MRELSSELLVHGRVALLRALVDHAEQADPVLSVEAIVLPGELQRGRGVLSHQAGPEGVDELGTLAVIGPVGGQAYTDSATGQADPSRVESFLQLSHPGRDAGHQFVPLRAVAASRCVGSPSNRLVRRSALQVRHGHVASAIEVLVQAGGVRELQRVQ